MVLIGFHWKYKLEYASKLFKISVQAKSCSATNTGIYSGINSIHNNINLTRFRGVLISKVYSEKYATENRLHTEIRK